MKAAQPDATRYTLIRRACNPYDEKAWAEFVGQYQDFIFYVLNEMDVPPDDADDLAQQVLLTLTRDLEGYSRNRGRFRKWLSTVIRHAAVAYHEKQRYRSGRLKLLGENRDVEWIFSGRVIELDRLIENEWATYIASLAMEKVREVSDGKAVQAFELQLDGRSAAEISEETGLTVSSVYTLCKRTKVRLHAAIKALIAELEPSANP